MDSVVLKLMVVARQWDGFLLSEVLDFVEAFFTGSGTRTPLTGNLSPSETVVGSIVVGEGRELVDVMRAFGLKFQ